MAKEATAESKSSKSKLLIIVLILAFIVIVVLAAVIFWLMNKPEPARDEAPAGTRATIVTEDNVDEVMAQAAEPVEAGYYNCEMNVEWHFEDATKPSYDAYVANSVINTHTVYFDVNLEDSDELLVYSSPYMPVGSELEDIQLTEELEAGTYPAVVTYHLVDEEKNELSTVAVTVTLFIEN